MTPGFDKHEDSSFFDVANIPGPFKSTEIKAGGDRGTNTVTGNLQLNGVTNP